MSVLEVINYCRRTPVSLINIHKALSSKIICKPIEVFLTIMGENPSRYDRSEVQQVFADRDDSHEPLTAREVADSLGCHRTTAEGKLHGMDADGRLRTKKIGARARVWWIPDRWDSESVDSL